MVVQSPRPIPSADCSRDGYLIQYIPNGNTGASVLYRVSLDTGAVTQIGPIRETDGRNATFRLNAIGYNPLDDYLYGMSNDGTSGFNLVRFNPQGNYQNFTATTQLWNAGDVNDNGQLFVRGNPAGGTANLQLAAPWAQFDLNPNNRDTYLTRVASGNDSGLTNVPSSAGSKTFQNVIDWVSTAERDPIAAFRP